MRAVEIATRSVHTVANSPRLTKFSLRAPKSVSEFLFTSICISSYSMSIHLVNNSSVLINLSLIVCFALLSHSIIDFNFILYNWMCDEELNPFTVVELFHYSGIIEVAVSVASMVLLAK